MRARHRDALDARRSERRRRGAVAFLLRRYLRTDAADLRDALGPALAPALDAAAADRRPSTARRGCTLFVEAAAMSDDERMPAPRASCIAACARDWPAQTRGRGRRGVDRRVPRARRLSIRRTRAATRSTSSSASSAAAIGPARGSRRRAGDRARDRGSRTSRVGAAHRVRADRPAAVLDARRRADADRAHASRSPQTSDSMLRCEARARALPPRRAARRRRLPRAPR